MYVHRLIEGAGRLFLKKHFSSNSWNNNTPVSEESAPPSVENLI